MGTHTSSPSPLSIGERVRHPRGDRGRACRCLSGTVQFLSCAFIENGLAQSWWCCARFGGYSDMSIEFHACAFNSNRAGGRWWCCARRGRPQSILTRARLNKNQADRRPARRAPSPIRSAIAINQRSVSARAHSYEITCAFQVKRAHISMRARLCPRFERSHVDAVRGGAPRRCELASRFRGPFSIGASARRCVARRPHQLLPRTRGRSSSGPQRLLLGAETARRPRTTSMRPSRWPEDAGAELFTPLPPLSSSP